MDGENPHNLEVTDEQPTLETYRSKSCFLETLAGEEKSTLTDASAVHQQPWSLPELKVHQTICGMSQLLESKVGQVKVVDISTARWIDTSHGCAAAIIL